MKTSTVVQSEWLVYNFAHCAQTSDIATWIAH